MVSADTDFAALQRENAALQQQVAELQALMERGEAARQHQDHTFFAENQAVALIVEPDTWRIRRANKAACRFYGYTEAEVTAMNVTDLSSLTPIETAQRIAEGMANQPNRFELRQRLRSGAIRDVEVTVTPFWTGDQRLLHCILHDTTAHKAVAAQAERQRHYLAALYETTVAMLEHNDVATLLQTILVNATALLDCRHGSIYLLSADGRTMDQVARHTIAHEPQLHRISEYTGIVGQVWATGSTIVLNQHSDSWPNRQPETPNALVEAIAAVPLHRGELVCGVVVVAHLYAEQVFAPEQIALLTQYARLASLALEQARLYATVHQELEERLAIEAELRQLTERFQLAEEVVNGGVYDWHILSQRALFSAGFSRAFGYATTQISTAGTWWEDRIHPDDRATVTANTQRSLAEHTYLDETYRFRHADSRYRYVNERGHIVRDEHGQAIRVVGSFVDITDRHQADLALLASEERYRQLVEASPLLIAVIQADRIVYCNQATVALAGATDQTMLIGTMFYDYVPPEFQPLLHQYMVSLDTSPTFIEGRFLRLDGSMVELEFSTTATMFNGEPAVQIVAQDITERKQVEMALRESEERYRRLVELAPMAIVVYRNDIVLYANARAFELARVPSPDVMIGHSLLRYIHPNERAALMQRISIPITAQDSVIVSENQFVRYDGESLDAEMTISPIMYAGELAYQVIINDITARRQAEAQRLLMERRTLEAQRMESLGILAGGIAHDFNNLLMSMLGNANLALLELSPQSPAHALVRHVEHAAQRAADLTHQMLAYAGRSVVVTQSLQINTLLTEMKQLLPSSTLKHAHIEMHLSAELPLIEADSNQLRQVVMNLLLNAVEAIGDQHGTIQLRSGVMWAEETLWRDARVATTFTPGNYVYFDVNDSGCGMDAATMASMFEPFFSTKFVGRGLGLAAVLGVIRAHRGSIVVQSALGAGTTIKVLLPLATNVTPPVSVQALAAPDQRKLVLIIDDEREVRHVTELIVKRLGYTTLVAKNGHEGIALFREHASAIMGVLLDLTMPELSGEATWRALQAIDPTVRILLMSGYSETDINERFGKEGLVGFLAKPFMIEELRTKLAMLRQQH